MIAMLRQVPIVKEAFWWAEGHSVQPYESWRDSSL